MRTGIYRVRAIDTGIDAMHAHHEIERYGHSIFVQEVGKLDDDRRHGRADVRKRWHC